MMHYVWNMMIHFKHIEILLFRECIILIPFCLILSKTYLMGDVSWTGWLTPGVRSLEEAQGEIRQNHPPPLPPPPPPSHGAVPTWVEILQRDEAHHKAQNNMLGLMVQVMETMQAHP